jgi:hypothetical protein
MLDLKMRFNKKIIFLKRERKSLITDITDDDSSIEENSTNEEDENFDDYLFRVKKLHPKLD